MAAAKKTETISGEDKVKFESGIPEAVFVEDVDSFMQKEENSEVDKVLKKLDEEHCKYKFMELNLLAKKRRLRTQIPDLENSLDMITLLQERNKKEFETNFLLSDQTFMKAAIPPTDKVMLWLGANVMLEYTLDDASQLLTRNIYAAKKSLCYTEFDLDFLRDQFTTTEVNMARVYNWDVKRRMAEKGLEEL